MSNVEVAWQDIDCFDANAEAELVLWDCASIQQLYISTKSSATQPSAKTQGNRK